MQRVGTESHLTRTSGSATFLDNRPNQEMADTQDSSQNYFFAAAPAQLIYDYFGPKSFVRLTLSLRTEGVFRRTEGLSVRELGTQSQNDEGQMEVGWELAVDF